MGSSRAEKADSRERILDAAACQIRRHGTESISIAELMKAASLTHGGFYGHFPSRVALIAAAIDRALERGEAASLAADTASDGPSLSAMVDRYLSPAHRDNMAEGCAISALSVDVGRADDDDGRVSMTAHLERAFDRMALAMGMRAGSEEAVVAWCIMTGALTLARVFRETKRSDEILRAARNAILTLEMQARGPDREEQTACD